MKEQLMASVAILGGSAVVAEDIVIRMAAPDWGPTRFMQDYANETYNAPSGNTVTLEIDFIPWPDFSDRVNASLASGPINLVDAVMVAWVKPVICGGVM